jgi:predicted dinucleotide-binding enzyme
MTSVTILGNGSMGQAIAAIAAKSATTVQVLGSADADVAVTGDIVVLAVPHPAVAGILAARGGQLEGKVVVDISNPVNFETFDSLVVAADSSKAAEIAAALPGASVVKAFNTNFAATLATGVVGSNPTTVLVAGDDASARTAVIDLVTAAGLGAIDAGALSRARELEAIGFLQITLAAAEKIGWTSGFAVVA